MITIYFYSALSGTLDGEDIILSNRPAVVKIPIVK